MNQRFDIFDFDSFIDGNKDDGGEAKEQSPLHNTNTSPINNL